MEDTTGEVEVVVAMEAMEEEDMAGMEEEAEGTVGVGVGVMEVVVVVVVVVVMAGVEVRRKCMLSWDFG